MSETMAPNTTKELYDMMLNTPNLCGKFELVDDTIFWYLFDGIEIEISIGRMDTYFGISRKKSGKIPDGIIHWHPDCEEIYNDVLNIGLEGNVLVIQKNILYVSVIYSGKEEECPYSPETKRRFGKIFYLKAKRT